MTPNKHAGTIHSSRTTVQRDAGIDVGNDNLRKLTTSFLLESSNSPLLNDPQHELAKPQEQFDIPPCKDSFSDATHTSSFPPDEDALERLRQQLMSMNVPLTTTRDSRECRGGLSRENIEWRGGQKMKLTNSNPDILNDIGIESQDLTHYRVSDSRNYQISEKMRSEQDPYNSDVDKSTRDVRCSFPSHNNHPGFLRTQSLGRLSATSLMNETVFEDESGDYRNVESYQNHIQTDHGMVRDNTSPRQDYLGVRYSEVMTSQRSYPSSNVLSHVSRTSGHVISPSGNVTSNHVLLGESGLSETSALGGQIILQGKTHSPRESNNLETSTRYNSPRYSVTSEVSSNTSLPTARFSECNNVTAGQTSSSTPGSNTKWFSEFNNATIGQTSSLTPDSNTKSLDKWLPPSVVSRKESVSNSTEKDSSTHQGRSQSLLNLHTPDLVHQHPVIVNNDQPNHPTYQSIGSPHKDIYGYSRSRRDRSFSYNNILSPNNAREANENVESSKTSRPYIVKSTLCYNTSTQTELTPGADYSPESTKLSPRTRPTSEFAIQISPKTQDGSLEEKSVQTMSSFDDSGFESGIKGGSIPHEDKERDRFFKYNYFNQNNGHVPASFREHWRQSGSRENTDRFLTNQKQTFREQNVPGFSRTTDASTRDLIFDRRNSFALATPGRFYDIKPCSAANVSLANPGRNSDQPENGHIGYVSSGTVPSNDRLSMSPRSDFTYPNRDSSHMTTYSSNKPYLEDGRQLTLETSVYHPADISRTSYLNSNIPNSRDPHVDLSTTSGLGSELSSLHSATNSSLSDRMSSIGASFSSNSEWPLPANGITASPSSNSTDTALQEIQGTRLGSSGNAPQEMDSVYKNNNSSVNLSKLKEFKQNLSPYYRSSNEVTRTNAQSQNLATNKDLQFPSKEELLSKSPVSAAASRMFKYSESRDLGQIMEELNTRGETVTPVTSDIISTNLAGSSQERIQKYPWLSQTWVRDDDTEAISEPRKLKRAASEEMLGSLHDNRFRRRDEQVIHEYTSDGLKAYPISSAFLNYERSNQSSRFLDSPIGYSKIKHEESNLGRYPSDAWSLSRVDNRSSIKAPAVSEPTVSLGGSRSLTESISEVIHRVSENLARSAQRVDDMRRMSLSSPRGSVDYSVDAPARPERNRRETDWTRLRSLGPLQGSPDVDRWSNHSSFASDDMSIFAQSTPRSSFAEGRDTFPDQGEQDASRDSGLVISPTYQNFPSRRRTPPPLPHTAGADTEPPPLPPRRKRENNQHSVDVDKRVAGGVVDKSTSIDGNRSLEVSVDKPLPEVGLVQTVFAPTSDMLKETGKPLSPCEQTSRLNVTPLVQRSVVPSTDNTHANFQNLMTRWKNTAATDDVGKHAKASADSSPQQLQHNILANKESNPSPATYERTRTNIIYSTTYMREPAQRQEATAPFSHSTSTSPSSASTSTIPTTSPLSTPTSSSKAVSNSLTGTSTSSSITLSPKQVNKPHGTQQADAYIIQARTNAIHLTPRPLSSHITESTNSLNSNKYLTSKSDNTFGDLDLASIPNGSSRSPSREKPSPIHSSRNIPSDTESSRNILLVTESLRNIPSESSRNIPSVTESSRNIPAESSKNIPSVSESSRNRESQPPFSRTIPSEYSRNMPSVTESSRNIPSQQPLSKTIPSRNVKNDIMSNRYSATVGQGSALQFHNDMNQKLRDRRASENDILSERVSRPKPGKQLLDPAGVNTNVPQSLGSKEYQVRDGGVKNYSPKRMVQAKEKGSLPENAVLRESGFVKEMIQSNGKSVGDERFSEGSYIGHKSKFSRAIGSYKRSKSAAVIESGSGHNMVSDAERLPMQDTKLGHQAWNSESALPPANTAFVESSGTEKRLDKNDEARGTNGAANSATPVRPPRPNAQLRHSLGQFPSYVYSTVSLPRNKNFSSSPSSNGAATTKSLSTEQLSSSSHLNSSRRVPSTTPSSGPNQSVFQSQPSCDISPSRVSNNELGNMNRTHQIIKPEQKPVLTNDNQSSWNLNRSQGSSHLASASSSSDRNAQELAALRPNNDPVPVPLPARDYPRRESAPVKSLPADTNTGNKLGIPSEDLLASSRRKSDGVINSGSRIRHSSSNLSASSHHARLLSQEEIDCDETARLLAEELPDKDRKLSEVLMLDVNKKRMLYMDGLFSQPEVFLDGPVFAEEAGSAGKTGQPFPRSASMSDSLGRYQHPRDSTPRTRQAKSIDLSDSTDLAKLKEELMEKLHKKLDVLKTEKVTLERELADNSLLGEQVLHLVDHKCQNQSERDKLKAYVDDLEKVVRLLLNLSGQLARAESAVQALGPLVDIKVKILRGIVHWT